MGGSCGARWARVPRAKRGSGPSLAFYHMSLWPGVHGAGVNSPGCLHGGSGLCRAEGAGGLGGLCCTVSGAGAQLSALFPLTTPPHTSPPIAAGPAPPAAGAACPSPSRSPRRCTTTSALSRTCSRPPSARPHGEHGHPSPLVPRECRGPPGGKGHALESCSENPPAASLESYRVVPHAQLCRLCTV